MPEYVDLPLPLRGMNVDSSRSQIDPEESPELLNVLLHEANQMRPRQGWTRKANWRSLMTTPGSDVPVGVWHWRNRLMISMYADTSWAPYYFTDGYSITGATASTGGAASGSPYGIAVNADSDSSITAAKLSLTTNEAGRFPIMPGVQYENSSYAASGQGFDSIKTLASGSTSSTLGYPRIVRWAGQYASNSTSVTATVNEGSTTVTLSATLPNSMANYFLRFTSETNRYEYSYQIKSHTAGTSTLTLYKPYGLGEAVGNKAAQAATIRSIEYVAEGPVAPACVAVHQDRLWAGRAVTLDTIGDLLPGEYRNAITWSDPGEPEKWPDSNIIVLDDRPEDSVMGFGKIGRNLAVFFKNRIYEITGYSNETYSARLVTAELGCVDARTIVQYREGVIFQSVYGVFYYDGAQFQDLTQPRPGHGVRTRYRQLTTLRSSVLHPVASSALIDDYLLVNQQRYIVTPGEDHLYCFLPSGAWSYWGNRENSRIPLLYTSPGQRINDQVWGLFGQYAVNLSAMTAPESTQNIAGVTPSDRYDQCYNETTAATQDFAVPVRIRLKDYRISGGQTVRVRKVFVEHNVHYPSLTGAQSFAGYKVYLGTDPNLNAASISPANMGTVAPRRYSGGSPDYSLYYTDEYPGAGATTGGTREGAILRVTLLYASSDGAPPHSMKVYGVRVEMEGTKSSRVDNPVL